MKKKIMVGGMNCGHCANHVSLTLEELGSKDVDVNLDKKFATAEISEDIMDEAIKVAIEELGYEVIKIDSLKLKY